MMEWLLQLDQDVFLFLNDLHTSWLDPIMLYATQTITWVPLHLLLLFLILKEYRNDSWAPLLGILLTILLADQITSGIMKPIFQRLRPSHEPSLEGLVHIVSGYKGGKYGFASSHAANTFALATYFSFLFRTKYQWILILFFWAAIVSYTRIYLGVHYLGDVLAGIIVGVFSAFAGFKFFSYLGTFMKTQSKSKP
jgi:undecaprenyl-diphosphatase